MHQLVRKCHLQCQANKLLVKILTPSEESSSGGFFMPVATNDDLEIASPEHGSHSGDAIGVALCEHHCEGWRHLAAMLIRS